jgi:NADPH-dependent 2,4-dienoyl-CoA reductase/sulfur reductase-like enzyme
MNELLLEAARNTPIIAKPDVLVVGGGAAGLGAAMAAARSGASTLLVERQGFLGGTLTAVTLGTLCGGYVVKGDEHRQIVGGIYANLVDRLSQRKASLPPRRWLNNVSVPYDPSALRIEADRMAESAGIRLLLHTLVVGTQVTEGRITAVLVEHKGGRGAIIPRLVIDASGDGDVAAHSGADFTIGDSGHTQFPSTMLSFGGVNINRFLEISREERLDRLAQAAAPPHPPRSPRAA